MTRPAHEAPPELRAKAADTRTFLDVQWDTFMQADLQYMARALELGQSVRRHTSPNPWVGAVIVRDGQIIGTGATRPPGGLHAEIVALQEAGTAALGATLYTTLEPCCHVGRTPPCTDAIIAAGIRRVCFSLLDPDPHVAGRGIEQLEAAGIEVMADIDIVAGRTQLAAYLHHRITGRPYVTVKLAQSLDSSIAAADRSSQWITGDAARADAHELRADSDALVVGSITATLDQPTLTVRGVLDPPSRPPRRVVLDTAGRLPVAGPLFVGPAPLIITSAADPTVVTGWQDAGAEVAFVPAGYDGVDLDATFLLLGSLGYLSVTIEGGATLAESVLRDHHAQKLVVYIAPLLLGTRGLPAFSARGPDSLDVAERYQLVDVRELGDDIRVEYDLTGR